MMERKRRSWNAGTWWVGSLLTVLSFGLDSVLLVNNTYGFTCPTTVEVFPPGPPNIVDGMVDLMIGTNGFYIILFSGEANSVVTKNSNPEIVVVTPLQIDNVNRHGYTLNASKLGTTDIAWDTTSDDPDCLDCSGTCSLTVNVTGDGDPTPIPDPDPTPTPTDTDPTDTPGVSIGGDTSAGELGDPISTFSGELFTSAPADFNLGGPLPLRFSRYYAAFLAKDAKISSALGTNWLHTFDWVLNFSGESLEVVNHQGRVIQFEDTDPSGTEGAWNLIGNTRIPFQLIRSSSDQFMLADPSTKLLYTFEAPTVSGETGTLLRIEDGKGNTHTLSYDANNKLTDVDDGLGRTLTFGYDANDKLTSISDGTRTVTFGHTGDDLTSVTNALSNETTFTYASDGLMTTTTRPEGNTPFTQTFDADGRALTQTDANGNTHTLEYAGADTTAIDPLGQTLQHTHSTNGELTDNQDQGGNTFTMGYDGTGRRNAITDRLGDTTSFSYHEPSGNLSSVTNADSTTTNFFYTARALDSGITLFDRTEVVFPDGTTQGMAYDTNGSLTVFTDQAGNESTFTYNDRGQPLTATNAAGGVVTHAYNADGTRASRTDPSGNTTTFVYDGLKRLSTITHADGTSRAFTYDNNDNLLTLIDESGQTTTFTYDANNNFTGITNALGQTTTVTYDGMDRITTVTDALGQSAARTYDALGRLKTVTDRTENTTTFGYDARGRLTSVTDGEGHVWPRTHDLESILASMADPLAHTTTVTSDTMGRITSVISPLSNITDLTYDTMGRVTDVTNPNGDTTTSSYDARGLLAGTTIADGAIAVSLVRNALRQLTTLTDPNANDWTRVFDLQGRLVASTDPLGNNTTFDYDTRNRVARVNLPESTLDLTYDASGNVTRRLFSDGTDLTFDFDTLNRLTTANDVVLAYDDNGRIIHSNGIGITRDANGRISSISIAAGKTVTYRYDRRNLLTQVTDWLGGTTIFSYDAAAQLTEITRPNGVTTSMTYDQDGRMSSLTEGNLSSIALTRDAHGQITGAARNVPLSPMVPQSAVTARSYDAASQVAGFSYDAVGRLTADGARTYTWDLASRLTSVSDGTTVTFAYDGLGTRISRTEGMTTRDYLVNYALGLPSISVVREGGADLRYDIHTPGGALLYSIEAGDETRRDYHYDEMGNTAFLTDASGTVIARYAYSPYGALLETSGSVENPYTWQGRFGVMQEGANGLYYMRARYYDSATGRFISRDPVRSIDPKSINPYQYALGNPLRFVDPKGLRSFLSEAEARIDARKKQEREATRKWLKNIRDRQGLVAAAGASNQPKRDFTSPSQIILRGEINLFRDLNLDAIRSNFGRAREAFEDLFSAFALPGGVEPLQEIDPSLQLDNDGLDIHGQPIDSVVPELAPIIIDPTFLLGDSAQARAR